MATRLRIVLVACLLVFILMDANPVLVKKGGGRFKKLEDRVKEFEKSAGGEEECKACQLIDGIMKQLNETREETAELVEAVSAFSSALSSIDELKERVNEMGEEIEQLKNPPTPATCTTLPPTPTTPEVPVSECNSYNTLAEADRKVTYGVGGACDSGLTGWYRFVGAAGTKMATSPPGIYMCGTSVTGWLNGAHPTVADGQVTRQVCFHFTSSTCQFQTSIAVRNCGSFYVYNLHKPPAGCALRYCGSD